MFYIVLHRQISPLLLGSPMDYGQKLWSDIPPHSRLYPPWPFQRLDRCLRMSMTIVFFLHARHRPVSFLPFENMTYFFSLISFYRLFSYSTPLQKRVEDTFFRDLVVDGLVRMSFFREHKHVTFRVCLANLIPLRSSFFDVFETPSPGTMLHVQNIHPCCGTPFSRVPPTPTKP